MKIAAYCRVSTDKEDQLNSLEAQKQFFLDYASRNGHDLVETYADEGISGTKLKNRTDFLRLMQDANNKKFDMVVVKDISRFARNTVDLLNSTRQLRALNIETLFITSNMTTLGNSEFVLTIFGALAQEESANISKRTKFGKKINAQRGKVPNIVFGYDKTKGDYFNLKINEDEANVVKRIFDLYINSGNGTGRIAAILNAEGLKTKRGASWHQVKICNIIRNPIYKGILINGKEEIEDFLTGVRKQNPQEEWFIIERPDLQIVDAEIFDKAQEILHKRHKAFSMSHERQSNKYLFSTLIKCSECGWSFRRTKVKYKNTYVRWICSRRNQAGINACKNTVKINETELEQQIISHLKSTLDHRQEIVQEELDKFYKSAEYKKTTGDDSRLQLSKLEKRRQKYLDMYADDLIDRKELNTKIKPIDNQIKELKLRIDSDPTKVKDDVINGLNKTFDIIEDVLFSRPLNNAQLKKVIKGITVYPNGEIEIRLSV